MEKPYKRLFRSKKEKILLGLMTGLGEYFRIDPVILRIAIVALMFLTQAGLAIIVIYLIFALVVPYNPEETK